MWKKKTDQQTELVNDEPIKEGPAASAHSQDKSLEVDAADIVTTPEPSEETQGKVYKLGDIVSFNETGYSVTILHWRNRLLPILNEITQQVNDSKFTTFDQDFYLLVVNDHKDKIRDIFFETIKKEITNLSPVIGKIVEDSDLVKNVINGILMKVDLFHKTNKDWTNQSYASPTIEFTDCKVEDGKAVIDEEAIKERFRARITNGRQLELLDLLEAIVAPFNAARAYMKENGISDRFNLVGEDPGNSMAITNQEGYLQVLPDSVILIK